MKQVFTFLLALILSNATAQTTADFENYNLPSETALNGADNNGGFSSGNIFLFNNYTATPPTGGYWNGWSISNTTDTMTQSFLNFSAITGEGVDNSETYAIAFVFGEHTMKLEGDAVGEVVNGMYLTNATYAYTSMRDGDVFGYAKQFGGFTGDDPDYLLLTIKAYSNGQISADSVNFYLADYRFADNTQDYLVDEWTYVDLTSLGAADSLNFTMSSSDNDPTYGMNTPAYFCVDNVTTSDGTVSNQNLAEEKTFEISPNPTSDFLVLKNLKTEVAIVSIFDMMGKNIYNNTITNSNETIDVRNLPCGSYVIKIQQEGKISAQLFVKQ